VQYAYTAAGGVLALNGTIDLQSASTLDANGAGGLLDVSGLISSSAGGGGLTIASSITSGGVVRFGSANTYLGDTTVNSGATLRMNATNALPFGSAKGGLSLNGTLDLNAQATTSLNGLSGAGTIDNSTGAGTYALSVGNNDQTSAFSGVIQDTTGTLGLVKAGTGTQTLSGTNSYSGNTTVNAGTLRLTSPNTSNEASTVTIAATGATLELDFAGTDTVDNLFIGATQMADGVYKSNTNLGAGTAIAQITGEGTLTVGGSSSNYASWANDPAKGNIPGEPASGDFDNDGLSNLTEYALGKNPRTSSQPAGVLASNVITFTKGADAIANGDVSWVIETSATLAAGSWTPQVTQAPGDPAATISYTFTPSAPLADFARLKITQN
jgi:autotransporter-associated beta strand protein